MIDTGKQAKKAGDDVLSTLIDVCLPHVKGAHDADFVIVGRYAYIVYEANDLQLGHGVPFPYDYCAMSIVDVQRLRREKTVTFAASGMVFDNETLPTGRCFVPRIVQIDDTTLRCLFASQNPGNRQDQTWYIDFDIAAQKFGWSIHRMMLKTDQGVFPMQSQFFHEHAVHKGFTRPACDHGMYLFDSFKTFDGKTYTVLNNFPGGQTALAVFDDEFAMVEIVGDFFFPIEAKLTEAAANKLPDGRWMAITRQDNRAKNYMFTESADGITWTEHRYLPSVQDGTNSKPTFDSINGRYYLGWQEATQIENVPRSVFNLDVSADGRSWRRLYRFESGRSFQYPTFKQYNGTVYLTVTQGTRGVGGTGRIMFGTLHGPTNPH